MNIVEILKKSKKEIVIIGVAGIGKEIISFLNSDEKPASIEIIVENENYLFAKSRLTDNSFSKKRISFHNLLFENRQISEINTSKHSNLSISVCYIDIPIRIIISDGITYINNWITIPNQDYNKVELHIDNQEIKDFIEIMLNKHVGKKYSAPYYNKKGAKTETIELFDEDRIRRGIFPRSAFYDSDFIKLVVWVFIFDRQGNMLIHKRSANAKDNRDMWDKSVGGHADYKNDIDTSKTVPRETIEELITNETASNNLIKTNDEDVIFLGEWKPELRKSNPFLELNNYKHNWAYFRLKDFIRTTSPRILPDGTIRSNEVIADCYLFLLSEDINSNNLENLENSAYKLLDPNDIKNAMDKAKLEMPDENFDNEIVKFTPDMKYAFSSKLRNDLIEFSEYIKLHIDG